MSRLESLRPYLVGIAVYISAVVVCFFAWRGLACLLWRTC